MWLAILRTILLFLSANATVCFLTFGFLFTPQKGDDLFGYDCVYCASSTGRRSAKVAAIKVAFHFSALAGRKELVLTSLNGRPRSTAHAHTFPATTLQIPALWPTGKGELSGSDPWAGPFWPEPVLRTRAFYLRTDQCRIQGRGRPPPPPIILERWREKGNNRWDPHI